jgi:hypothetical protein
MGTGRGAAASIPDPGAAQALGTSVSRARGRSRHSRQTRASRPRLGALARCIANSSGGSRVWPSVQKPIGPGPILPVCSPCSPMTPPTCMRALQERLMPHRCHQRSVFGDPVPPTRSRRQVLGPVRRGDSYGGRPDHPNAHPGASGPFAERFVRTVRRECLAHILIYDRRHLERVLRTYAGHYTNKRPHRRLHLNEPVGPTEHRVRWSNGPGSPARRPGRADS